MIARARALSRLSVLVLVSALAAGAATIGPLAGGGFAIPDDTPGGASSAIISPTGGAITDVTVTLDFGSALGANSGHSFIGDLVVSLSFGGMSVDLFNCIDGNSSPGCEGIGGASAFGDNEDLLGLYSFNDAFVNSLDAAAASTVGGVVPAGNYFPTTVDIGNDLLNVPSSLVATFGGKDAAGAWTLTIVDQASGDTGGIVGWELTVQTGSAAVPEPGTISLLGLGLLGLAVAGRRRFVR